MRFLLSSALLIAAAAVLSSEASAATVCGTGGSTLNVRTAGSMHASRRSSLPPGANVQVIGRSTNGSWVRIRTNGRTGWVYASYVCGADLPNASRAGNGTGAGSGTGAGTGGSNGGSTPIGPGSGSGSGSGVGSGSPIGGSSGTESPTAGGPGARPGDPASQPNGDGSNGGFDPSALGGLADLLGNGASGNGGSNGGGGESTGGAGSNGGGSSAGGGSNAGGSSNAGGDTPTASSSPMNDAAAVANALANTGAGRGQTNGPGVLASPEECERQAQAPAFDPLAGVDPFCASCVASRLESLGMTIADLNRVQGSVDRVGDTMTAILGAVETGSRGPDYGQITVDSGGITYGFYQADRRSGELSKLLKRYVQLAQPPTNETRALARYAAQLANGRGAALDRSRELKQLLTRAASDPAMQQAQREVFRSHHLEPGMSEAAQAGLRSPLGVALYLDIKVNGGIDAVMRAARKVVPRIQTPADEARFIKAMLDAREARYKRLAARGMRKYLAGWLSRNEEFRRMLRAGNLDLAGNLPIVSKGFTLCGGSAQDAQAFRDHMASLARRA